eukprot:TRINITY_DN10128_c0_g1_i1.p1 TRINITY_DN10128_c0_g1~~TRINITY_DN10128_c0_g1_i1.p1  ORF type:complete len:275 (-),score=44.08 TRINITY_DN10128_c0_g1_i1:20-844(-)
MQLGTPTSAGARRMSRDSGNFLPASFTLPSPHVGSTYRKPAVEALTTSFTSFTPSANQDGLVEEGCCNANVKVLGTTGFLFMLITTLQSVAAVLAHSEALWTDCISMAVDSMTYFLNMCVEFARGTKVHRGLQLTVPLISISVLVYFTIDAAQESWDSLNGHGDDDDDVNPWIVFLFATLGIAFDAISLYLFIENQRVEGRSVNMCSAVMHVIADLLRSLTTFVESLMIFAGYDGGKTDALASLIVSGLIIAAATFALYEWLMSLIHDGCRRQS